MQFRLGPARRSPREPVRRSRPRLVVSARAALLVVVLCLALISTGCSGDDGDAVYAGRDTASALLIQWTDAGNGRLTGSVQLADEAVGPEGEPVKQTTLTFTGRLDSKQVSLQVKGDTGPSQTWNGRLDGDELRVDVPQGGKGVDTVTLNRGSADQYNSYVSALEKVVVKQRADAARAAAESQRQSTNAAAATRNRELFDNAVSDVSTSQETVSALLLDPPELEALAEDLAGARKNLALVKSNVGEAASRSRGFVACEYASQAEGAAGDVDGDASFLEDDARAVTEAADDLADAHDELSRAYVTLQQVSDREGPSSKSASPALRTLVDKARGTSGRWRKAVRKADKKMKAIVSEANTLATNARRASC